MQSPSFARESRAWVARLSARFHTLHAVVWEEHAPALRWLRWLGFTPVAYYSPFIGFVKEREPWAS